MMWYWNGGAIHWWEWFIGLLLTVLFWALVIFLIVVLIRSISTQHRSHSGVTEADPERLLARRFANGEINEEEFHRSLDALRRHGFSRRPD